MKRKEIIEELRRMYKSAESVTGDFDRGRSSAYGYALHLLTADVQPKEPRTLKVGDTVKVTAPSEWWSGSVGEIVGIRDSSSYAFPIVVKLSNYHNNTNKHHAANELTRVKKKKDL